MATTNEAVSVIVSCISLVGIWLVWRYGWKEYRVEAFRQELFSIRQELFDYAAQGNLSFNDPVYRGFRHNLNTLIRFAHQITLFRVFAVLFVLRFNDVEMDADKILRWRRLMKSLPENKKEKLEGLDRAIAVGSGKHILSVSIVLPLFFFAYGITLLVPKIFVVPKNKLVEYWRRTYQAVEVDAQQVEQYQDANYLTKPAA